MSPSKSYEYVKPPTNPAHEAKRIRILARALQQGRPITGYTKLEIEQAKAMIGQKAK